MHTDIRLTLVLISLFEKRKSALHFSGNTICNKRHLKHKVTGNRVTNDPIIRLFGAKHDSRTSEIFPGH